MSYGPTHFRNETIRLVTKALRTSHHLTQPYCPWSNGFLERLGREFICVARALLTELQLSPSAWPDPLPIFQSALNQSPSIHRGNVAQITPFTGLQPTPPLSKFLSRDTARPVNIDEVSRTRSFNIAYLQRFAADLHPVVKYSLSAKRGRSRAAGQRGELANFTQGDYISVAREDFHKGKNFVSGGEGGRPSAKALV